MEQIKACLFDLDGVLVDTAKYHYKAWKEIAQMLGYDFTKEDNELLKGVSRIKSMDILIELGNIKIKETEKLNLIDEKNKRYVSFIQKMTPDEVLPGVIHFLEELKNIGIKIGLGSASKNTPLILEKTELADYFDVVIDGNKVEKAKPDPEVFLKGAHELGIKPANSIVFEDAIAGIEAAKRGGMKCIGIGRKDTLQAADLVIPGFVNFTVEMLLGEFS